jgi:rhodanese-related sulfurtransferase
MPTDIARDELQRLVASGAQLVEVLPREEYAREHLPGAISLPLEEFRQRTLEQRLRREDPVIVYCQNTE